MAERLTKAIILARMEEERAGTARRAYRSGQARPVLSPA